MKQEDYNKAKSLSDYVKSFGKYKTTQISKREAPKKKVSLSILKESYAPRETVKEITKEIVKENIEIPAEEIANRLNTLDSVIDSKVIKDLPTKESFVEHLKSLKGNERIDISNIRNGEALASAAQKISMNDQRWHGGGLASVTHDATLTGAGTTESPLSVVTTTSGVNTINADNTPNQFLVSGDSGTDFVITDDGIGTHTFDIPTASGTNRGLLSSADWITFNDKLDGNAPITGATKTKVTYDSNGLVTAGADATTADIADSTNARYVTDAQLTVIGNTSGTNTGDNATNSQYSGLQAQIDEKAQDLPYIYQLLGSTIKAQTVGVGITEITTGQVISDGVIRVHAVYLPKAATLTGVKWWQVTQGSYTADTENRIGLYTYSAGVLTLVASTTDDGDLWKGASNTLQSKAFSSTYNASAGLYFVGFIYQQSAQVTQPSLGRPALSANAALVSADFTNSAFIAGFVSAQTTLPSSITMSDYAPTSSLIWFGLY